MRPAVFLDRDGTLIVERPGFLTDPKQVELHAGAAEAVRRLNRAGYRVLVVSNQSAVARGLLTELELAAIHGRLVDVLADGGAHIDGFYYCPHHPDGEVPLYRGECDCRKPRDGMLRRAIAEHRIDPAASFLIGDDLRDVQSVRDLPVRPILVRTGKGTAREAAARDALGDRLAVVDDLPAAVEIVLA